MILAIYNITTGQITQFMEGSISQLINIDYGDNFEFYLNCPKSATHIRNNEPVSQHEDLPELQLKQLRDHRNNLLQLCDWTQMFDSPLSSDQKSIWAEYRQLLRDIDFDHPTWPKIPE